VGASIVPLVVFDQNSYTPLDLSADTQIIAGFASDSFNPHNGFSEAVIWKESDYDEASDGPYRPAEELPQLPYVQAENVQFAPRPFATAYAISGDGKMVVGEGLNGSLAQYLEYATVAYGWTTARGAFVLWGDYSQVGFPPDYDYAIDGVATAVDDNGIVYGTEQQSYMFQGILKLDTSGNHSPVDIPVGVDDVTPDGSVRVGSVGIGPDGGAPTGLEPYRWTDADGVVALGALPGATAGDAVAVSADGKTVVGFSKVGTCPKPFRWTKATGMVALGSLGTMSCGTAYGVSRDGSVVVGTLSGSNWFDFRQRLPDPVRSFIWTQATGMRDVADVLASRGIDMTDWVVATATNVSEDGKVVIGSADQEPGGFSNLGYRATIP
jgi:uncharacterized membrane protein